MSTFVPFSLAKYGGKLLFMKTQSPNFSAEQIGLLRRNLCRELSEDDFALFVQACERTGLDPFARHIYPMPKFVWRGRQQETTHYPEVSIDGLRACAERTGNYAGQLGPEWCGPDGEWKDIWLGDDPPTGARVGILRKDFDGPVWGKALYAEYLQIENGQPARLWGKMDAESRANRSASGDDQRNGSIAVKRAVKSPVPISGRSTSDFQPDHGAGLSLPSSSRPVPPQLQGFVARATERKTVVAALKYLHDEMLAVGGIEGGRIFQRITLRVPRSFRTREACAAANIECWLDIWDELQKLKEAHEFAPAVNS